MRFPGGLREASAGPRPLSVSLIVRKPTDNVRVSVDIHSAAGETASGRTNVIFILSESSRARGICALRRPSELA